MTKNKNKFMFKKLSFLVLLIFMSCNFETPTQFSELALNEKVYTLNDTPYAFKDVLNKHKGKKIFIDVWASWCRDCLEGLPKVKELQKENPDVVFMFLSVDERINSWKRGVKRYQIKGEHYNLPKGMKNGDLVDFLNLRWIPRYIVIDEQGKISLFKATNTSDKDLVNALKKSI
ncbi:TlpA disulfide reductase family protein [uncultured Polaribacter sp.]|uniref:TlpA family protein disulfide reductase n=1 Tax=uncultured Polaribacter sp. TaxID=174711 RepID=UPI0026232D9C|nr:TlpA disulfide reductase family protein [uncultured Polaribacter sp.]